MATPKKKDLQEYLQLLAHLTRLLDKEYFRESLLKATSAADCINQFRKVEKR